MSVTDGQHKVPVAIQRPAPGRRLTRPQRWSGGAEVRARTSPGTWSSALFPRLELEVSGAARAPGSRAEPAAPGTRWQKQIQGLHFRRLPDVGLGKGEGLEIARARKSFLSPLRSQDFTSLYGQRGKKIKKTYKITIEKVILLGEAPLWLGGVFDLFFFFFFFLLM